MYTLLPFRFDNISSNNTLITNDSGEYYFLTNRVFNDYLEKRIEIGSTLYSDLKQRFFITENDNIEATINRLAIRIRTKKSFLSDFTSLHMIVPTLRCNSNCIYCQANSHETKTKSDVMNIQTAKKSIDYILSCPCNEIKIEFQGGEPLLAFDIVKKSIEYCNKKNKDKKIDYVICTNLLLINSDMLEFIKKNHIYISTSLDGPREINNMNRRLSTNKDYYELFKEKLEMTIDSIGIENISALMTTTVFNIEHMHDILQEYINLGFKSIFIRNLNTFGKADKNIKEIGYDIDVFLENYLSTLHEIIDMNKAGNFFIEELALIYLYKILTPFSTGFVDLRSPSGLGIGCAIYNYNGDVYASDEGRMLGKMGDNFFRLGNIFSNSYTDIFSNDKLKKIVSDSILETTPRCKDCVFVSYCGSDPVKSYIDNSFHPELVDKVSCYLNKHILTELFGIICTDSDALQVFWSWITNRRIDEVKLSI